MTELAEGLLPPPGRHRPGGSAVTAGAVVLLVGVATGSVTAWNGEPAADPGPSPGVLVQFDYAVRVPPGWRHTGGMPERRRTLLTPDTAPAGSDLIVIEQTPLGYDSAAEPARADRELRDRFRAASASDPTMAGPIRRDTVSGRSVAAYRQVLPNAGADVDWYVLFDRDVQLSVGCGHTPAGAAAVARACAGVVGSVARTR
jgi:type VII secretion-associated protein (TIGR03931 family)